MLEQAVFLWVGHDVAPRGLSPQVKGFVQAQSYFQDLTRIRMD
jgi:peptide/nickel transport system substrate-binding protein